MPLSWEMTKEEIEDLKENIIYLDKFVLKIAETRNTLEFEFGQIKKLKDDDSHFGLIERYKSAIFFKLEQLLNCFVDLEREILSSSTNQYYDLIYSRTLSTKPTINKVTSLVDSFITQYFSLLDIFIKFVCKLVKADEKINGLGYFLGEKQFDQKISKIFKNVIDKRGDFQDFKNYRDYLIHHGNLSLDLSRSKVNDEYSLDSFNMHEITKLGWKQYTKNQNSMQKVNVYLRYNLRLLLNTFLGVLYEVRAEDL